MKEQGKVTLYLARDMEIWRSSSGCRIVSSALRENSGSSSRKRTPLWARLISPGRNDELPPISATTYIYDFDAGCSIVHISPDLQRIGDIFVCLQPMKNRTADMRAMAITFLIFSNYQTFYTLIYCAF